MKLPLEHKIKVPIDDGGPISFKWHFKRGTLESRMSAFELAGFVLKEMPYIAGLLSDHPRAKQEFEMLTILLASTPEKALNKLVPWIRSITHTEYDDIIHLSLFDKTPIKQNVYF
jgi:hypothetical protein